jgi:hypothetical protein
MKRNYFFVYFSLIFLITLILSCSKKNNPGNEGPPGMDGSTIFSGQIDPNDTTGRVGDYYLNIESRNLFGPKTESGWGTGISLKGDKGDSGNNGEHGSSILNGATSPTNQIGKNGDFYIDLSNMDFYGPKTNQGWGSPIALIPKRGLEKRILIKTNFGYSKSCEICSQYVPASSSSTYSIFSSNSAQEIIKPGDISEYYKNGIVVYEASINDGEWFVLDPGYSRPIINNYKFGNREYYTTFYPNQITYSESLKEIKIGLEREIRVPSLYSKAQLMEWLDTDIKISIKITLLPKESVEYLTKTHPNHTIDKNFIVHYLQATK